jgi:hypothetical protein
VLHSWRCRCCFVWNPNPHQHGQKNKIITQTTGRNYLQQSLNFSPKETDEFMQMFVVPPSAVVLAAVASPPPHQQPNDPLPARKKQKSDPAAVAKSHHDDHDNESQEPSKQQQQQNTKEQEERRKGGGSGDTSNEIDQYKDLTKAKLMTKMNELGVTDYNPRWKKQQLVDLLEEHFIFNRKQSAVPAQMNDDENLPTKHDDGDQSMMDISRVRIETANAAPIATMTAATTSPVRGGGGGGGLVQRAIAHHENRHQHKSTSSSVAAVVVGVREVSCESACKKESQQQPLRGRKHPPDDERAVVVDDYDYDDDHNENVVPIDVDKITHDRYGNDDHGAREIIDLSMVLVDLEPEAANEPLLVDNTTEPEQQYPARGDPPKATTPAKKFSPSIQLGAVKSAKKMLLGYGLATDPQQAPARPIWKQPAAGYHSATKKKPDFFDLTLSAIKRKDIPPGIDDLALADKTKPSPPVADDLEAKKKPAPGVDEAAAKKRPPGGDLSTAKQKPAKFAAKAKPAPTNENLRTPSAMQPARHAKKESKPLPNENLRTPSAMQPAKHATKAAKPPPPPVNENLLCTPSTLQAKALASPSYNYKMKERHAKLLKERSKRVDQMTSAKVSHNISPPKAYSLF